MEKALTMPNLLPNYTNPIQNTLHEPYRCVNMVLRITSVNGYTYTLGVVEGSDIQMGYANSKLEPIVGSRMQQQSTGIYQVTFTITRWYFADDTQRDLLLNLFSSQTSFSLEGQLYDNTGSIVADGNKIQISGCKITKYRPVTGSANDIIGEEASGVGTNWGHAPHAKVCPVGNQIIDGGFESPNFSTYWTGTSPFPFAGTLLARTGSFSAEFPSGDFTSNQYIEQTLANPVSGACLNNASLWYYNYNGTHECTLSVILTYDDSSTDTLTQNLSQSAGWIMIDFKSIINISKRVSKIRISVHLDFHSIILVDDVVMMSA